MSRSTSVQMVCKDCRCTILWKQIQGMRTPYEHEGKKRYPTKCGCGHVDRSSSGTKLEPLDG